MWTANDPTLLFPSGMRQIPGGTRYERPEFEEYVALVVRELRAGKVQLSTPPKYSSDVFVVKKKGGLKQRLIWDGSPLSGRGARPPHPPQLANPHAPLCADRPRASGHRPRARRRP
jgi:hypothetical protein